MNILKKLAVFSIAAIVSLPATAGTFTGLIKNKDGQPMEGVLIRLSDDVSGIAESIYSNPEGKFRLETNLKGSLNMRLRTPYYRDLEASIELGANSTVTREMVMQPMESDYEISASLPAAYHFGSLPFETGEDAVFNQFQFQRDCLSCHQLGNAMTRIPRDPELWHQTIIRMHRYMGGTFDEELRERRSVILSKGFNGEAIKARPKFPLDPSLSNAKYTEYRLDKGNPHDAIVNQQNGLIYSVDQTASHMAITDPKTGKTEYVSQYGKGNQFHVPGSTTGEIADFAEDNWNAPHSLSLGTDNLYYVTNTSSNTIGVFNPVTAEWEPSYIIGGGANYPHTIRVDSNNIVWFTISGSEHLGRLDPASGETVLIPLPYAVSGGVSGGTQPYGIDLNPIDGSVWYGRLFADKIGRIDPATLEVNEFDSPIRGPRRMHFDKQGILWLSGYSEGMLARIEPTEEGIESKVYPMPEFSPGIRPAPYALGVHPVTQDIWLNENMTDRLYRFIPAEERFVVYPVPLRGTYTRDFSFTPDGKACASNNPFPLASLEGGMSEIVCIELNLEDSDPSVALRN